jgi:Uma2 family endonuclease
MAMTKPTTAQRPAEVYYPESDGKPMAETDLHRDEMAELIALLKARYAAADDVYVSGNLLLYYEEGNPAAAVAPDVFVVFGVPSSRRRVYKLWVEGLPPAVVIEVTSRKTRLEDLRTKMTLYARLGVAEYYLYDPEADYLHPSLQGYHLAGDAYQPAAPDPTGALRSPRLGLDLRLEDGCLQLYDTVAGTRLPRIAERDAALDHAAETLAIERARAEAAEAELARLRAEVADRAADAPPPRP